MLLDAQTLFSPSSFHETNYVEMYAIPIDNNLAADNGITKNVMEKTMQCANGVGTKE